MSDQTMNGDSRKLSFVLETRDDWPGFSLESLWTEKNNERFRIKSIPFFVKGLAYDDEIRILKYGKDGIVEAFDVVLPSGNSTIWIYVPANLDEDWVLEELGKSGIGFEGGVYTGLITANLPEETSLRHFDDLIRKVDPAQDLKLAYPALRHEDYRA